jgi:hypothetical protein
MSHSQFYPRATQQQCRLARPRCQGAQPSKLLHRHRAGAVADRSHSRVSCSTVLAPTEPPVPLTVVGESIVTSTGPLVVTNDTIHRLIGTGARWSLPDK